MIISKPKVELLDISGTGAPLRFIEEIGRNCYQSQDKITDNSYEKFIRTLIQNGHESVLEHVNATFKITTDRGTSHQIVRHRIASYSQESTRYVEHKKPIEEWLDKEIPEYHLNVIAPFPKEDKYIYNIWLHQMEAIEKAYNALRNNGASRDEARAILPNCTKTTLMMTANIRQWRHFIRIRGSKQAHENIRFIAHEILKAFQNKGLGILFEDIEV